MLAWMRVKFCISLASRGLKSDQRMNAVPGVSVCVTCDEPNSIYELGAVRVSKRTSGGCVVT